MTGDEKTILIRKSFESWDALNPVLEIGEIGLVNAGPDLGKFKRGDGVTRWRELPYATIPQEIMDGIAQHNADTTAHQDIRKESADALEEHNSDLGAHEDIRQEVENTKENADKALKSHNEAVDTHEDIRQEIESVNEAIEQEAISRSGQIEAHNQAPDTHEDIRQAAAGRVLSLNGALLTRVIGGTTEVAKNLFDPGTPFVENKTIIFDVNGTAGFYVGDVDGASIDVLTKSVSPVGSFEPVLLGNAATTDVLPATVNEALAKWGRSPKVDDYAVVFSHNGGVYEFYVIGLDDIDGDGDAEITWGNERELNTSDYQTQTTAADAGKVLAGGAVAGTFGDSLSVDTEPEEGSVNLLQSGGVWALFGAALTTLKTTAKTIVGALNELFEGKQNSIPTGTAGQTLGPPLTEGGALQVYTPGSADQWIDLPVTLGVDCVGTFNARLNVAQKLISMDFTSLRYQPTPTAAVPYNYVMATIQLPAGFTFNSSVSPHILCQATYNAVAGQRSQFGAFIFYCAPAGSGGAAPSLALTTRGNMEGLAVGGNFWGTLVVFV